MCRPSSIGGKLKIKNLVCFGLASVLGLSMGVGPAHAETGASDDVYAALDGVRADSSTEIMDPLAGNAALDAAKAEGRAATINVEGNEVTLPSSTADPLELTRADGTSVSVRLPKREARVESNMIASGVIGYDNGDGSHTVPLVKNDGSVQITTVIEGPNSPTTYGYDFDLPGDAKLKREGDSILFISGKGAVVGGIAPAWAVDANGVPVPTRYEIEGNTLTQVVEHGKGVAYPVVADPLWGTDLIQSAGWISRNGLVSLSLVPTGWNRFNAAFGPAISEGWNEALAKTPSSIVNGRWYTRATANTTQMYWQYQCHQVLGFAKSEWNLEPSNYRPTYADYSLNGCN